MSSTYTTRLKLERQASGANSGNWGNLVNYVLNRIDSTVRGYVAVSVAGSANVTLVSNNSTNNTAESADDQVHNKVIEFTGALGAAIHVFTDAVEGDYTLFNNTTGSYALTFANTGHAANGVAITQGTKSIVYTDGSTIYDVGADLGEVGVNSLTSTGKINAKSTASLPSFEAKGDGSSQDGYIQLNCSQNSHGIKLKSPAHSANQSYTLTFPTGNVTADRFLKVDSVSGSGTTGVGQLSFSEVSGGIAWQSSVVTAATLAAVSGNGYWLDTSSNGITVTLPGSPAVGDEIIFTDYARNWETNAVTFNLNSLKFQGNTTPVPVYDTAGETVWIVYSGATKGWIPISDGAVINETAQSYTADFLAIGGGGGSAMVYGGGGGAGGYRNSFASETSGRGSSSETALTFTPGVTYTITVGAGGAGAQNYGGASPGNQGITGDNSVISGSGITTVTSNGGGGGAENTQPGKTGGCGGGAGSANNGGAGTAAQGYDGGQGGGGPGAPSGYSGGGGGGAGAAGLSSGPTSTSGVAGGAGLSSSITGSAVLRGGGGGGGSPGSGSAGPGGSGGGGGADVGTANTGGGGGATNFSVPASTAAHEGGSGVVILSVPDGNYSGTTTGSPTVATGVSGKTVITFNSSGSYTG